MKTTEQHPVASIASPTGNSFDGYGVPALAVITPPTSLQSESAIQADPPVDEHTSDRTFTAEECSSLSMRHLRRLCDEAFTELDVDFPEWGVRDRYDMLCAEVTARADALRNHPNSRGASGAREVSGTTWGTPPQPSYEVPASFKLRSYSSVSPGTHHHTESSDLSDRQAVVAVMFANGLVCEDIAFRLSLPLQTVEGHLGQAMEVLGLSDVEDLTYAVVASHYNRNSPTARARPDQSAAEDSHQMGDTPEGEVPAVLESAPVSRTA